MRETLRSAWDTVARLWHTDMPPERIEAALSDLCARQSAPTLWLFGKTQSGKTSIVKYLTGADDAAIGSGFRPCTRTSRKYPFPVTDAPLVTFLDTRGVDEPNYDPAEDIAAFDKDAHLILVTLKLTDFGQQTVHKALATIRRASPQRPVILVLTCLHEAVAGQPLPAELGSREPFAHMIAEHREKFAGLIDAEVAVDLTRPEEGFAEPYYGGEELKQTLLDHLPAAYRQSLTQMADAMTMLSDLHQNHAAPLIVGYASLAASAAALPVPFVDLVLLPAIQAKMAFRLALLYGQEMTASRLLELTGSLGIGLLARQAVREVAKLIPFAGSAVGATLAWASTYALGRALCKYYEMFHDGHVPRPEMLKKLYAEQFAQAKARWRPEQP